MKCQWCRLASETSIEVDHLTFCSEACVNLYRGYCKRSKQKSQDGIKLTNERLATLLKEGNHGG